MPATHRSMLLRFFRDAEALVTDRSIPEAVRKEISDIRVIFRQTWADIEAQAQADAEGKDTNETAAPVRLRDYAMPIREVIRHEGSKWVLYTKDGKRKLGEFDTKKEAIERERQVNYFKHQGEAHTSSGGTMDEEKKKLAEQEELPMPGEEEAPESEPEGPSDEEKIAKEFVVQVEGKGKRKYDYWLLAVSTDPANGLAVIVQSGEMGTVYAVPYIKTTDGYAFSQEDDWQEAEASYAFGQKVQVGNEEPAMPAEPTAPTPNEAPPAPTMAKAEPTSDNIAEVASNVAITEDAANGPVVMHVELIQPGPGNAKDAHYYPKEVLARDSHVFNRAHMYESDHGNDKTTRTWVSTITGIIGTSEKGAPIAEVLVHDPDFAQRVRNLAAGKLLNELQCSIMATGAIRKGEMDGKSYNIVEQLVSGGDVDWVTKAGAGGHAVAIAESAKTLSTPEIDEWLHAQALHEAVKARLRNGKYASIAELESASQVEIHYLKEVTGSGQVIGMAEAATPRPVLTEAERKAKFAEIDRRYGIRN